jgi:hypothetical protein
LHRWIKKFSTFSFMMCGVLKERRGYSHVKEEALDRTICGELALEEVLDLALMSVESQRVHI